MGESTTLKTDKAERPIELKIVVFLEVFLAIRYLIYTIAFLSLPASTLGYAWATYLVLMIVSLLLAYGLWRFAKIAWMVAIVLSALGILSTLPLLAMGGISFDMLWQYVPSIALDLVAIVLLLRKSVKSLFWGARNRNDLQPTATPPQNP